MSVVDQPMWARIEGRGNEVIISILLNHFVMSKAIGDSFLEIIRNDRGTLVNLMPIGAERMIVIEKDGRIIRYEILQANGKIKQLSPEKIFHKTNERMSNENTDRPVILLVQ